MYWLQLFVPIYTDTLQPGGTIGTEEPLDLLYIYYINQMTKSTTFIPNEGEMVIDSRASFFCHS